MKRIVAGLLVVLILVFTHVASADTYAYGMPLGDYRNIRMIGMTTICIYTDGTVDIYGGIKGEEAAISEVEKWTDIIDIRRGSSHWLGLKEDGTVLSYGENEIGECNVEDWTDIISISAGRHHSVGLKADGTVVATGDYRKGQCDVENWTDIVAIDASRFEDFTIGLKSDGSVMVVGSDEKDYNYPKVDKWKSIVDIAVAGSTIAGLQSDGLVVSDGRYAKEDHGKMEDWMGIINLEGGTERFVGFKKNGKFLTTASYSNLNREVDKWQNIQVLLVDNLSAIGIQTDGTILTFGDNNRGELDIGNHHHVVATSVEQAKVCYVRNSIGYIVSVEEYAKYYLEDSLFNPSSLQVHSSSISYDGNTATVIIDYSAMNKAGGYTRTTFVCMIEIDFDPHAKYSDCKVIFAHSV